MLWRGSGDLLILGYHAVSPSWPESWSIAPEALEEQVTTLLQRGYVPVTLTQALTRRRYRRQLVITFDDAFASVVARAAPCLDRLGAPATLFVPVAMVGSRAVSVELDNWLGTPHEHELIPMDWLQIAERQRAGWEIGSHTLSHPRLTRLDDEDLAYELRQSRALIEERLNVPCRSLAYPFGDYDSRVTAAAADAGYVRAVTLYRGRRRHLRLLELPRIAVRRELSSRQLRFVSHPLWRASEPILWRLRRLCSARSSDVRPNGGPTRQD